MNSSKIQAHQFSVRIRFKLVQYFRSSSDDTICMIYTYTQNDCNRSIFKENNLKILRLILLSSNYLICFLKKAMVRKVFFINLFQKRGEEKAPKFMPVPREKILASALVPKLRFIQKASLFQSRLSKQKYFILLVYFKVSIEQLFSIHIQ